MRTLGLMIGTSMSLIATSWCSALKDGCLGDLPPNADPALVSRRVSEQFLRTRPENYCPPGYRGNGYCDNGYGGGRRVQYAVVSIWVNALECARLRGDRDMEEKLIRLYDDFLPGGEKNACCSRPYHVDDTIFGSIPYQVYLFNGDRRCLAEGNRYADTQWTPPCEDTIKERHAASPEVQQSYWERGYTPQTRLWIDDMYMIIAIQSQAYRATGDRKYIERTAKEMCLYLDELQLKEGAAKGLFYHAPDVKYVWGRGDGWMAGGMTLVLKHLPEDSQYRPRIMAGYRMMMETLLKYQRADGKWSQLVDMPEDPRNWAESSCSAMFAYAFITGVKRGWLSSGEYGSAARRAWIALCDSLDEYANVPETCCGTGKRDDLQYYFDRTRVHGDPHGQAPMLWCAGALMEPCVGAASISVACPTRNEQEYRRLAEFAKAIGATHLDACQVEDSLWQWNANRYDPYPNWSMHRPSVFKFIVPPELEKYIPADYARRNLDNLKMRARVMREYGFKANFDGMEPAYFPEQAYLDHPEWRGARCDQCRRARFEYYAPCVDNPEVRAFYVRAITELCKVCPFDRFELRCNDSGSAICWSPLLYPGMNGPGSCRDKPYGKRVAEFLGMFQEGAAAAGLPGAKVNVRANLVPRDHLPSLLSQLRPGQSVNSVSTTGATAKYAVGFPNRFNDYTAPVYGLSRMGFIAEQLQKYQEAEGADLEIGLRTLDECDAMDLLRLYLKKPIGKGPEARWAALRTVAAGYVGEGRAVDLVQAWEALEEANKRLDPYCTGGHLFLLGSLHQRWITRPLVAFPGELTGEDRRYWREYIFQAQSEEDANNLLDLQANRWLSGHGGSRLLTMSIYRALSFVERAIKTFKELDGAAVDARAKAYLARQAARAEMYRALMINARHVVEFQSILDRTDFEEEPEDKSLAIDEQGDARLQKVNEIVRAEINNTLNMIRILDTGIPVFSLAPTPEQQTIMVLGPGIRDDLKRKIAIMEAHRRDFLRLYKSPNR